MVIITGATGNIGQVIVKTLLARGKAVRAIARDSERLRELGALGADIAAGSVKDSGFLSEAFHGASSVFILNPPNLQAESLLKYQNSISDAFVAGLEKAGVSHVVNLSSLGAEHSLGTGPIVGLHFQEEKLNRLKGMHVLHLRPAFFMENLLANIPLIKDMGINGLAMNADVPLPMIATRDIAMAASEHLVDLNFKGKTIRYLLGSRDLSMREATAILGRSIGNPDLPCVQFPYQDAIQGMTRAGIGPDVAKAFAEMGEAVNNGLITPIIRTAENTTPTSFEEFADTIFAPAFRSF